MWGSSDDNPRGERLLDFIVTTDLQICNKGNKPTFTNAIREEVIDLTLATPGIEKKIRDWKVSDEESFSDHNRIEFKIGTIGNNSLQATYKNIRKTDWNTYIQELKYRTDWEIRETDSLEDITQRLTDSILEAHEASCRTVKNTRTRKPPWWTRELNTLKREAQKCKRRYKRNPTDITKENKKTALRLYSKEIQKAKRMHWQNFCQEMLDLSLTSRISRILKSGERQTLGTIRDPITGEYTETPEGTLKILLEAHFPNQNWDDQEGDGEGENALEEAPEMVAEIVNKKALEAAFSSFQPYKSPGMDGIYPAHIQKGMEVIGDKLLKLYEKSIKERKPPRQWAEAKIAFIPKPGKTDYTDPKAYRPLSLTSFLHKGVERMIHWNILDTAERENPTHQNLFSYREGRSTEDALHRVVNKIESCIGGRKVAVAVFLDIEAAFSNATMQSMTGALQTKGIRGPICKWIEHSLKDRTAIAMQDSFEAKKKVNRGCPQGGILSPYIWNLIMEDLLNMVPKTHPTEVICYADDVMILGTGIDEQTIVDNLKRDIKMLETWANKHRLRFSPSKTKMILFSRRRNKKKPVLKLYNTQIEWVESFRYLGLTLDSRLSWTQHIQKTINTSTVQKTSRPKLGAETQSSILDIYIHSTTHRQLWSTSLGPQTG